MRRFLPIVLTATLAAGCTGDIAEEASGPGSPPASHARPEPLPTGAPPPAANDGVGPAPIRRLTRLEYNKTLRDLLDDTSRPGDAFAADLDADGAGFVRGGAVSAVDADHLMEAVEKIGARALEK